MFSFNSVFYCNDFVLITQADLFKCIHLFDRTFHCKFLTLSWCDRSHADTVWHSDKGRRMRWTMAGWGKKKKLIKSDWAMGTNGESSILRKIWWLKHDWRSALCQNYEAIIIIDFIIIISTIIALLKRCNGTQATCNLTDDFHWDVLHLTVTSFMTFKSFFQLWFRTLVLVVFSFPLLSWSACVLPLYEQRLNRTGSSWPLSP